MKIGALDLSSSILQSPLAGCSDLPFRLIARGRGLGFAYAEMVSAQSLTRDNLKTRRLLTRDPADRPVGAQLLGRDPGMMAEGAAILEELGFDLIDLNLGCPVKKVVSNGEGSALLREPVKAGELFCAVRRAVKRTPLTVKMRKGFLDPSGAEAVELALRAEDAGFDAVTVHGRTQAQQYAGKADWEAIGRVKRAVGIPVIGNGDVLTPNDATRIVEVSGCDAVMIGRGGLGNPWIYGNLEKALRGAGEPTHVPTVLERKDTILRHLQLERDRLGERQAALNMRRVTVWYTQGLPRNKPLRAAVCATIDCDEIKSLVSDFFDRLPAGAPAPAVPILLAE